jgi:hypothetical protein
VKRHHWLLVGAAALLAAAWLAWNVLLVESDVAAPENQPAPAPLSRATTARTIVS